MMHGEQCVMTYGAMWMQESSVPNLDLKAVVNKMLLTRTLLAKSTNLDNVLY